jgi:hypothetical protein
LGWTAVSSNGPGWLAKAYGDTSFDLPAFQLGEHWVTRAANGLIYLNEREVASCRGKLVGALQIGELLFAGCSEELLLITASGQLVESVTCPRLKGIQLINNRIAHLTDIPVAVDFLAFESNLEIFLDGDHPLYMRH